MKVFEYLSSLYDDLIDYFINLNILDILSDEVNNNDYNIRKSVCFILSNII